MLDEYLANLPFRARQDLAVDYARVFVAAGLPQGNAAFPYESVYTSPERLVMQDACDEVKKTYRAKGLIVEDSVEPPDHIAFELEFMARLADEGIGFAQAGEGVDLITSITEQIDFLVSHLLNWSARFTSDVQRYSQTGFYKAIALMTQGFLEMDAEELRALAEGE